MADGFSIRLDQITEAVIAAIPAATFKAMEHVRQVAVNRTPIETGNLRTEASTQPTPNGANVVYPGPYARYQHYELLHHERGGERLYLSKTVAEETPKVLEIVANELRAVIE
jgi:hypothetical protein